MIIEIVNEVGGELVNVDDVERIIPEDTRLLVLHRRLQNGKQWTDKFQFNSRESMKAEYMNVKEQLADLNCLSAARPHLPAREEPAAGPRLQIERSRHEDAVDRGWTGEGAGTAGQDEPPPGQA
jgi:hypothetical protein